MPGPYIHVSSMLHVTARLSNGYTPSKSRRVTQPKAAGVDPAELSRILSDHTNFTQRNAGTLVGGNAVVVFEPAAER